MTSSETFREGAVSSGWERLQSMTGLEAMKQVIFQSSLGFSDGVRTNLTIDTINNMTRRRL
jgi:hypothetical protein